MALETACQTPGAVYSTQIHSRGIKAEVRWSENGREVFLTPEQAELLDANIHNVLEIVLAPYFRD
jgi:hypothetical protein